MTPMSKLDKIDNRLLAALKPRDLALVAEKLEIVNLPAGHILFQPGQDVQEIHFPTRAMIAAFVLDLRNGDTAEAAMVGQEGGLGAIISEGEKPAFSRGVVQIGGAALRLHADVLDRAKSRSPALRDHFARYADCLLAQVLQSVACNAIHDLDTRLARWLLGMHDRLQSTELRMTQEFVAQMLGVHRPYAARILKTLEKEGLIRIHRGMIEIVSVSKLKKRACECYGYLRRHFERVLPGVYPG